jgi:DNA-directed RNA polymerase subunit M/transcription elongation factor TFIIS
LIGLRDSPIHLAKTERPMPISIRCENLDCNKPLKVKDSLAGKRIKCPSCGHKMTVPEEIIPVEVEPEPPVAEKAPEEPPVHASPPPAKMREPAVTEQPTTVAEPKPGRLTAKRQQYGLLCPQCSALLLPPAGKVNAIACGHCGGVIELI